MASGADAIGSVSVQITGDASKLNSSINAAVDTAKAGGEKISSAFSAAAIKTATLQLAVDTLKQKLDALNQSGVRTASQQQQMESTAARLAIANARLANSLQDVGHAAEVSGQQATSALIRVGEGSGGLRAVENFLAKTLGLGPAMQALFPIVGAVAFSEIIGRMGGEIVDFFEKASNYSRDFQLQSNALNNELRSTNAELAVSNDRLGEELAKLTGTPSNGLKSILDEDIALAERLEKTLGADIDKIDELLKKESVGAVGGFFTGRAATTGNEDQYSKADAQAKLQIDRITRQQDAVIAGARIRAEAATTDAEKKKALDDADFARALARNDIQDVFNGLVNQTVDSISKAEATQRAANEAAARAAAFSKTSGTATPVAPVSQSAVVQQGNTRLEALQNIEAAVLASYEEGGLKEKVAIARTGKENAEEAKKAAEEWLKAEEKKIALQKSQGELSTLQEIQNYDALIAVAKSRGPEYADIITDLQIKAGDLNLKYIKERGDASVALVEKQGKEFADKIKQTMEDAAEAGQLPKTAGLQVAQTRISAGVGTDVGGYQRAMQEIPELTRGAAQESEQLLKQMVEDSDTTFEQSGNHTASAIKAHADQMIAVLRQIGAEQSLIDAQIRKSVAAGKQIGQQGEKIGDIDAGATAAHGESDVQAQKIALQGAYAEAVNKTSQDQITYTRQLSALDEQILRLKQDQAEADAVDALAVGDVVKAEQDSAKWLALDDQIRNHRLETETKIAEITSAGRPSTQISAGLYGDVQSAGQRLASSFGQAVASGNGIGQVFEKAMKGLEASSISTVFGVAIKQGLEASGISTLFNKVLGATPQIAATTANTTALTVLTAHITAMLAALGINTGATTTDSTITATHGGIMTAHLGVMTAHLGVMISHLGVMIANTLATLANTIAIIWNSIVLAVKAIFGFASGGRPPVGVPSVIGEKGPELFVPDVPGTIIPNHELASTGVASGSSVTSNFNTGQVGAQHFHIYGMNNPREAARQIATMLKNVSPQFSPLNG